MKAEKNNFSKKEIQSKLEYYCAYQERCYKEVDEKLYSFAATPDEKEEILTYLIENNFINEERFAQSFVRKGPKKNKKFVDFLLRKGYETSLIYEKLNELNN